MSYAPWSSWTTNFVYLLGRFKRCIWSMRFPEMGYGQYHVRFVAAKSRVTPLKKLTIPPLEVLAAVLAAIEKSRLQFVKYSSRTAQLSTLGSNVFLETLIRLY